MAAVKKHAELSRELEMLSIKAFISQKFDLFAGKDIGYNNKNVVRWNLDNKILPESKKTTEDNNHFLVFQRAMKLLLIFGQCSGLNPVTGILETDITKVRYRFFTWKVFLSLLIGLAQTMAASLCAYKILSHSISVRGLGHLVFNLCTACTTFTFQRVATKWPALMKQLHNCNLQEYVDPTIKRKCCSVCFAVVFISIVEHCMSQLSAFTEVIDCPTKDDMIIYQEFLKKIFPWAFELNIMYYYYLPFGVILQILNVISTLTWNYSDMLVICVSIYLTSILNCINKKIQTSYDNLFLPPSYWRCLREEYNRATQLVRSFDDVISGVVLISFATNLFFICLQLFHCLAHGITVKQEYLREQCPNYPSGPFGGYEHVAYLVLSLCYLFGRSLALSLIAAGVHTASLAPAPALYSVAPSMYCSEVQRFLDQIHGDTIALSGLQFFYVTRELVLSVAGTIVTYELVLLQFSNEGAT